MKHATMEDLDEHMLTQIFLRLDSCRTASLCMAVNKHWCSLISNPRFVSEFKNHKKKRITPKLSVGDTGDGKRKPRIITVPWESEEPAWTFLTSMRDKQNVLHVFNASSNKSIFGSPKFSLEYLPCALDIEATFKDLVLCSASCEADDGLVLYYITNPLTKQWAALPPCPHLGGYRKLWTALICQHTRDDCNSQDYRFRVVLTSYSQEFRNVVVYCSEVGEWKKINVSVTPSKNPPREYTSQAVVCNGVVYFSNYWGLSSFNPFDVDQTTTDIEAKLLPRLPVAVGYLRECAGQLFVIYNDSMTGRESTSCVKYEAHGVIKFPLMVWKLDPNQVPHVWKLSFDVTCTSNVVDQTNSVAWLSCPVWHLGMHPNNERLIFIYLNEEQQLFLCNTRSRSIEPLKTLPGSKYSLRELHRLELQWWPTPVPRPYLSNVSNSSLAHPSTLIQVRTLNLGRFDSNRNTNKKDTVERQGGIMTQVFRFTVRSTCHTPYPAPEISSFTASSSPIFYPAS